MTDNYKIVINWSSEGNTFLAHVPELAGCIADGNSFAEAIENVQILIDQVIMEELLQTGMLPGSYGHSNKANFFQA